MKFNLGLNNLSEFCSSYTTLPGYCILEGTSQEILKQEQILNTAMNLNLLIKEGKILQPPIEESYLFSQL